ncbi:hypothetical protein QVD17_34910 [Tagetes erecta]|uniref:Uncharacterized protein n=1 Tax=Tagetes erecta TaxID=13708 RepID=A0AAD8JZY6_TARER|nr:hypothetical protein QVD17_34910 [Tagetes erecta]
MFQDVDLKAGSETSRAKGKGLCISLCESWHFLKKLVICLRNYIIHIELGDDSHQKLESQFGVMLCS